MVLRTVTKLRNLRKGEALPLPFDFRMGSRDHNELECFPG